MLNIIDSVIILFLLLGAVLGFKKGLIKSVVSLVGTIIVVVLAFTLKNPLSVILYTYLPFFKVGLDVINILIYEGIAFLILFSLLSIILRIVIKISGILETVLKFTIILAIPSKLLGALFGFLEMYVFTFIVLFLLAQFNFQNSLVTDSKVANWILSSTPGLSKPLEGTYNAIKEIVDLNKRYVTSQDKDALNKEGLEVMLKYKVLTPDNARMLILKEKMKIKDANEIIAKYERESKS